ncbi:MAG TPA: MaoC/PaaZ C-terminal domain-containing protein [Solirubrobacterales bacterium]|nr:MaoC/PaaZ C-terminal domain-containing protein [Solirubrobacterales bacterium]
MASKALDSSPSILPLYAKAAAPMIPGASLLPFVPGRGKEIPDVELTLDGVLADTEQVAAYARVCGFALRDHLPPTYPHMLAFPLHMAVMADGSFPFGAVGLVHIENRIVQHRSIGIGEELKLRVKPTKLEPHPKGRIFSLVTEARVGRQKVWESTSTMLRRGGGEKTADGTKTATEAGKSARRQEDELTPSAEWRLGGDLGRRYAAVSGDRNPIHMHSLTAKPLGFKAAIAHGMWTKARCLAAIENRLPGAFEVEVSFRKPIFLPARVELLTAPRGEEVGFAVRDSKRQTPHLDGRARPVQKKSKTGRRSK